MMMMVVNVDVKMRMLVQLAFSYSTALNVGWVSCRRGRPRSAGNGLPPHRYAAAWMPAWNFNLSQLYPFKHSSPFRHDRHCALQMRIGPFHSIKSNTLHSTEQARH